MIPRNPLTMLGTIDRCWLFTYSTPIEEARAALPPELEPVTHAGSAFWNVVVCHISRMRPRPLPAAVGMSYWHAAYRLYVRFRPVGGSPVEGIYFARSDCDSPLMTGLGNLLTDYRFHTSPIHADREGSRTILEVGAPDLPGRAVVDEQQPPVLPPHSRFSSLEEAAQFLKYKPFGLSVPRNGRVSVVSITREESAWKSRLVRVESADWGFFRDRTVLPEVCFQVEPIPYQWNRARLYPADVEAPSGKG